MLDDFSLMRLFLKDQMKQHIIFWYFDWCIIIYTSPTRGQVGTSRIIPMHVSIDILTNKHQHIERLDDNDCIGCISRHRDVGPQWVCPETSHLSGCEAQISLTSIYTQHFTLSTVISCVYLNHTMILTSQTHQKKK